MELDRYVSRKHDQLLAKMLRPNTYRKRSSLVIVDGFAVEITDDQVRQSNAVIYWVYPCTVSLFFHPPIEPSSSLHSRSRTEPRETHTRRETARVPPPPTIQTSRGKPSYFCASGCLSCVWRSRLCNVPGTSQRTLGEAHSSRPAVRD